LEPQKKKGRGISRFDDIFSRTPDMPKIKIMLNEYGQPVGENSRRLAGAIGIQARRTLPLGCDDWRLVDAKKKLEVWENIKVAAIVGSEFFPYYTKLLAVIVASYWTPFFHDDLLIFFITN